MTDFRKRSLAEILQEAQTMSPAEQLSFVRRACSEDEALYSRAISELQSQWPDVDDFAHDAPVDVAGELIGPYRIVRSLGAGGMGEVFLAERADDQFRQQVAIKLVRRGLLSRQTQGRLRQERQILASLDHPNIARLYDGGATADGTPYIVMEFIDGEPIDVYCDKRRLTIEGRLRLFMTICSAVHRAHQNLIVHRDLKPSNILVTREGVPKLLDFGIAKMLDDRDMMYTVAVTQADVRVMTPDHASPEQIRGELISTASDIYVLGVLLYELLCGYKPFSLRGSRLADLERAICEETPPRPAPPLRRRCSRLPRRSLRSPISDPPARPSCGGISRAIWTTSSRWRRGRSLNDGTPPSNSSPPTSTGFCAACLSPRARTPGPIARVSSSDDMRPSPHFQPRPLRCWSALRRRLTCSPGESHSSAISRRTSAMRAEAERERAEAVSTFLIDSFRLADPSQARGDAITAREILDRGAKRISTELRSQPDLQATLLDTIGSVYLSLGLPERAQPLVEQGLSIRRALGVESVDVARSLYSLNRVYEKQGDLSDGGDARASESRDEPEAHRRRQPGDCGEHLSTRRRSTGARRAERG